MRDGAIHFSKEWTGDTLWAVFARQAAAQPRAPALLDDGGTTTYGALATRVDRAARGLARLGIAAGDVVSVQLPNTDDFLVAYLALSRLGAVLSTIHMPYRARESAELMRAARSKAYIGPAAWHEHRPATEILSAASGIPSLAHVIAVGENVPAGARSWAEIATSDADAVLPPPPAADAPFLLLFTSGTSAKPKGIRADYRRFMANARLNHTEMRLGPDGVMLSVAPYTHLLGLFTFHMTLYAGAATLLLPEFVPAAFAATLRAKQPTHVFVAPAHVAACRAQNLLDAATLASVRFMVVSGASAPADLYRSVAALLGQGALAQVWGMTELQCGIFHRPGETVERVAASCGRPAPAFEARIADAEGRAPATEEGELQVRGVSVFDGYYENPDATAEAFTADGWLKTGDTARIDAEGYVTITGRLKDVINRGGHKINPVDVEEAIGRMPAVSQCAIAPVPDPMLGERACAYVVLKPGAALTLAEVAAWLAELGIAKIRWPERLEIIAEMPLTPTRKVIKSRLRPVAES